MASFVTPARSQVLGSSNAGWKSGVAFTRWIPSSAVKRVQGLFEKRDMTSGFRFSPAYQTATTDSDIPDAWATLPGSSVMTGDGVATYDLTDLGTALDEKYYVRFGVLQRTVGASAGTWQHGDLTAVFAITSN